MAHILLIDDDRLLCGTVEMILRSQGHEVASAGGGREGIARFRSGRFDLVACDIFMPNREGLETVKEIRSLSASLPIIAFMGGDDHAGSASDGDVLRVARELRGTEMLAKPFRSRELLALVQRCLESGARA